MVAKLPKEGEFDPVEENYKPIATGRTLPNQPGERGDEGEAQEESRE
jgi:hypothetical protein